MFAQTLPVAHHWGLDYATKNLGPDSGHKQCCSTFQWLLKFTLFLQIVAEKQLVWGFWHGKQSKPRAETYQTFTDLNMPTEGFSCYWFTVFSSPFLTSAKAHIIDSCEWKFLLCWNYYPWSQSARNAHDLESYQCYHLRKMSTHLTATCHKNKQTLNRWVQGLGDPSSSNPLLFR